MIMAITAAITAIIITPHFTIQLTIRNLNQYRPRLPVALPVTDSIHQITSPILPNQTSPAHPLQA